MTAEVTYRNGLRTEARHLKSGTELITDAPTDNHGKGEAFSPTDLIASALASCMLTVMGIKARDKGIDMDGAHTTVLKVMASGPRRISRVEISLTIPDRGIDEKDRSLLEQTGINCPVAKSLHPEIEQVLVFNWVKPD